MAEPAPAETQVGDILRQWQEEQDRWTREMQRQWEEQHRQQEEMERQMEAQLRALTRRVTPPPRNSS